MPVYSVPVSSVSTDTVLLPDGGFNCLIKDAHYIVHCDSICDELYVQCSYGQHWLDGQLDETGENYVGFKLKGEQPL